MIEYNLDIKNNDLFFGLIPKNEFYGVELGLKLVSYRGISSLELDRNIKLFFHKKLIKFKIMTFTNYFGRKAYILVYGKNINIVNFFIYFYENNLEYYSNKSLYLDLKAFGIEYIYNLFSELDSYSFSHIGGILLGYPLCCINFHLLKIKQSKKNDKWIYDSTLNIKDNNIYNYYYLNNIYNLGGRGYVHSINNNNNIYTESLSFINHQPCSFKCTKSLLYSIKLEQYIKNTDIDYLYSLYKKVKSNYLYFNTKNWLSFDYDLFGLNKIIIKNGILYDKILENNFKSAKYTFIDNKKCILLNNKKEIITILKLGKKGDVKLIYFIK